MSGLKTFAALVFGLTMVPEPSPASDDLPRIFANCAGQLSAMVEHSWLMQDAKADTYAAQRAQFLDLLDAVDGPSTAQSLNRRIDAKAAQAGLLREAAFGRDRESAYHAAQRAEAIVAQCRVLLLGG
ncbi:hypothetical protein GQ651_06430 [Alphaproteobacteria bacterium GH1-50]|uniref:Uncharacterized protein n=1 Tax=Kangsaoukella pontilimi TaxID=2691042 RepID=A0A7C9J2B5_9RHOB|nr:hypothetical protein [Kangsaoukella pontilimi]MXQ07481.1 hypothetical protein [Kangsaoukella pontilimi]